VVTEESEVRSALKEWVRTAEHYYVGYHFGDCDRNEDFEELVRVVLRLLAEKEKVP
jgi:hypothetical protein